MDAAVAQLFVVHLVFACTVASQFLNAFELLTVALRFLDLLDEDLGCLGIAVQVVVQRLLDVIDQKGADGRSFRAHVLGAELGLGLRLKHGLFDLDRHGGANRGADVDGVEVLLEEIFDGLGQCFAEGRQVGAAHGGVLAVDEGVVVLAVRVVVGERDFDVGITQVDDRIHRFAIQLVFEQVFEAVLGLNFFAVVDDGQPAVQVGVVPEHVFDVVVAKADLAKDFGVRIETQRRAIFRILGGFVLLVFLEHFAL